MSKFKSPYRIYTLENIKFNTTKFHAINIYMLIYKCLYRLHLYNKVMDNERNQLSWKKGPAYCWTCT